MKMEKEAEKAYRSLKASLEEAARHFITENDADIFLVAAQASLEQGQTVVIFKVLQAPENVELLAFVGWDLAKMVFQFLPDDCVNLENADAHISLLDLICSSCNPREICLSFSEILYKDLTVQKLVILLRLLKVTCHRLHGKITKILSSILAALQRGLKSRENILEYAEILETVLEFLNVLVEKTQSATMSLDDAQQLKDAIISLLIFLLEHVFASQDFKMEESPSELSKQIYKSADTIVRFLGILENGCLKRLLDYGIYQGNKVQETLEMDDEEMGTSLSLVGLGCLSYLMQVLEIGENFFPAVTTGKYSLDINMIYINAMLCSDKVNVISKGLSLLQTILCMVEINSLDHNYGDNNELSKLVINLRNTMIHCEDSNIRQDGVKGFRSVLASFTSRGKYKLLRSLFTNDIQSGFAELLTLILKEEILKSFQSEEPWFLGSNVASFLQEVFKLSPNSLKSEFGLIEESNRILSALNLLRFLIIRDKENKTTIQTMLPSLEETYLKRIRDVVELSKVRIHALIEEKQSEIKDGRRKAQSESVLSVSTRGGGKLDHGSLEDQLEALRSACLTIDMIECVLARIAEVNVDK